MKIVPSNCIFLQFSIFCDSNVFKFFDWNPFESDLCSSSNVSSNCSKYFGSFDVENDLIIFIDSSMCLTLEIVILSQTICKFV